MSKNEYKEEKMSTFKLFKEEGDLIKDNHNCFIYCDKNDCLYDDFFFKQKEAKIINNLDKNKSSIDLNLTEKNLHDFLNKDLIKALDNDSDASNEIDDDSNSNSAKAYIGENSEFTSNASSPEPNIRLPKNVKNIDMNLNVEKDFSIDNKNNINNISENVDNLNNKNFNNNNITNNFNNGNINNIIIDNIDYIKDKNINILNDPRFTPLNLPKKMNNKIEERKQEQEREENNEHKILEKKKTRKNNILRNKFDDDVEPKIMLSMVNNEERTKLPLEIRAGDWICLYCNNFNFSFRIKCNRCGLLRKSTDCLLKQKYNNRNKYQYMNYNDYNDGYNPYINYDENHYNVEQNMNKNNN